MSVINQMLKDLEQRTDKNTNTVSLNSSHRDEKKSFKYKMSIIVVVLIVVNIIGMYFWGRYVEQRVLKSEVKASQITKEQPTEAQKENIDNPKKIFETTGNKDNRLIAETSVEHNSVEHNNEQLIKHQHAINSVTAIKENKDPSTQTTNNNLEKFIAQSNIRQSIEHTPFKPSLVEQDSRINSEIKNNLYADVIDKQEKQPSLSISRRQLSPERVVKNKFEKAERAIMDNEILQAEKLFEEILIIQPEHKNARKQLSALWFGRKQYQAALNLLSQGINISPDDIDFRLMTAKILLNQKNNTKALGVLTKFPLAQNVEYQVLLANTAQSLGQESLVILAYQQLVILEPYKGKWWMGLAVAFDRNSQFEEAKTAYSMALSKESLSSSSVQFIRQRVAELGVL